MLTSTLRARERRRPGAWGLLALAMVLAGCGSGGGTGGGGTGGGGVASGGSGGSDSGSARTGGSSGGTDAAALDARAGGGDAGDAKATPDLGEAPDAGPPDGPRSGPDAAAAGSVDASDRADSRPPQDARPSQDASVTTEAGAPRDAAGEGGGDANADPCAGGTTYLDSTKAKPNIIDNGWVSLLAPTSNQIVEFTTTMVVPEKPPASGTLFLWPGLQPLRGAANFSALDNGVLQPVLTWGPTCAPNSPAMSYKSWWISGQYVNTNIATSSPNYAAYHDCHGGPGMNVAPGDTLDMRFALDGKNWIQTVTNRSNGQSVSYTLDMLGQAQGIAELVIEEYSSKPLGDVIFTSTVVTFASPAKASCQPYQRGANDYFTAPRASADGLRCCIDKITLRSAGVAATTPNAP